MSSDLTSFVERATAQCGRDYLLQAQNRFMFFPVAKHGRGEGLLEHQPRVGPLLLRDGVL